MIANRRRQAGLLLGVGFRAAPVTAVICAVLSIAAAACSVCYSIGFRVMIDGAIAQDSGRIVWGAVLVAGLFTLTWAFQIVSGTEGTMMTDKANVVLSVQVARLAAAVPTLEHFERSDLLGRLEQLTANRRMLAGAPRQVLQLLGQALRAIGIVVLLATVYWPVVIVPLLAVLPAMSDRWAARVQRRSDDDLAESRRMLGALFTLATSADDARELRTYGITTALADRHAELNEQVRARAVRAALLSSAVEAIGWIMFALGVVGAIVLLVLRAAHGHVSPGSVVMAVSLMRRAQTQISRSTTSAGNFNKATIAARQLLWLQDHVAAAQLSAEDVAPVPARLQHGIRLEGVRFAYPRGDSDGGEVGDTVLGPIDLTLPAGASVALVGENGAGKTTLVKLLCGMYAPSEGRITVDGMDLAALPVRGWRDRVSAAFQDFQRLQLILAESVGLGDLPRAEDHDVVRQALMRADAGGIERELPDGLRSRVGTAFTDGRSLSGGQWQRLALARGLMRADPLLVVLDEPTASLDAPSESALFDRYAEAAKRLAAAQGTITLLISHRFSTVRSADLIVVLDHGQLVESGSHEQLMAAGGAYAELFTLQARAYA